MGIFSAEEAEGIDQAVRAEIDRAVAFAAESPFPAPEEALEDVFA
jgi:pyruvate dehydrogenase E1 component alpha subunit